MPLGPWAWVPTISRFRGIQIRMYFGEGTHACRPHFHAVYGAEEASYEIADLTRLSGRIPLRIERLVRKWAREHRSELLENWRRGRQNLVLKPIPPMK